MEWDGVGVRHGRRVSDLAGSEKDPVGKIWRLGGKLRERGFRGRSPWMEA